MGGVYIPTLFGTCARALGSRGIAVQESVIRRLPAINAVVLTKMADSRVGALGNYSPVGRGGIILLVSLQLAPAQVVPAL